MKAAKDRREEYYDPARKDNILGRKKTRLELMARSVSWKAAACSCVVPRFCKRCGRTVLERRLALEYEHNNECQAVEVIGQDWSSEVAALFLEDWEFGRVACHMAMDLLCQEIRDACWDSSESLGSRCPL